MSGKSLSFNASSIRAETFWPFCILNSMMANRLKWKLTHQELLCGFRRENSLEPQLFQKVDQSKRKLQIKDLATSLFTANWIKEEKRQLTTFQSETV